MRRRLALLAGVAAIAIGALVALRGTLTAPPAPPPPLSAPTVSGSDLGVAARATAPALTAAAAAPAAPPGALPASLEGTDADGAVTADAAGHLVIDLELRRLFDHFLIASGEEPLATIRARIIAALRARLPATAAGEAVAILDRYLAYRDAARQLVPAADAAAGLDQIHDLRARMFTPDVVRAFFADEEAATYAALARRAVLLDPALSPAERDRRLAALDAQLARRRARGARRRDRADRRDGPRAGDARRRRLRRADRRRAHRGARRRRRHPARRARPQPRRVGRPARPVPRRARRAARRPAARRRRAQPPDRRAARELVHCPPSGSASRRSTGSPHTAPDTERHEARPPSFAACIAKSTTARDLLQ